MFGKLLANKRGQIQIVMALVVASVPILVGILVFYKISGAIPTENLSEAAQSAISNVITTTGSAFNLAPVILIVLVASGILGVLVWWSGSQPRRQ